MFKTVLQDFLAFLKQYGVIGMAVAFIIGGKLNELVSTIVNDLVMPLIFKPALEAAHVANIRELSFHGILYGKVIGVTLDFFIISFLVFFIVKFVLREETALVKK